MFFMGGTEEDAALTTPIYTNAFLNWAVILAIGAVVLTIVVEVIKLVSSPKNAVRTLLSIGILAVLIIVAYLMADGTPLNIVGYTGADNVPSKLIMTDIGLYTTYFVAAITLLTVLFTELSRVFRR
jgi:hypothetical protein